MREIINQGANLGANLGAARRSFGLAPARYGAAAACVALAVFAAGCDRSKDDGKLPESQGTPLEDPSLAITQGAAWQAADGPGESSIFYQTDDPNASIALICNFKEKRILAYSPGFVAEEGQALGQILLEAGAYSASLTPEREQQEGSAPVVQGGAAVSAELIDGLKAAESISLSYREQRVSAPRGDDGALIDQWAETCREVIAK